MSSATFSLSPFEITVAGRSTPLARLKFVRVHCQAHAATRFPPLETGFGEDLVQAFFFGLPLDQAASGYHHRIDSRSDLVSLGNFSRCTQVLDSGIGTGSDKDTVQRYILPF